MRTQVCTRRPAKPCRVPTYDCCDSEDATDATGATTGGAVAHPCPPRPPSELSSPCPTNPPPLAPPRPAAPPRSRRSSPQPPAGASAPSSPSKSSTTSRPSRCYRFLAASCVFLLIVVACRREPLTPVLVLHRLAALGVLNPGVAYALGLIGLTSITASLSVLLWALEPSSSCCWPGLVLRGTSLAPAGGLPSAVARHRGAAGDCLPPRAAGEAIGFAAPPGLRRLLCAVHGADPAA